MGAVLGVEVGEAVERATIKVKDFATTAELTVRFGEWMFAHIEGEQSAERKSILVEAAAEAAASVAAHTTVYEDNAERNFRQKRDQLLILIDTFLAIRPIFQITMQTPNLAHQKLQKLQSYNSVLADINNEMTNFREVISAIQVQNLQQQNNLEFEKQSLWKILLPFFAAVGNLQRLATDVEMQHTEDPEITYAQLATLKRGLVRVTTSLGALAGYILGKRNQPVAAQLINQNIFRINDIYRMEERLQN